MEARAVAAPGAEVVMTESDEPDAEVQGEVRILCKWNSNGILELIIFYVAKCRGLG
jgi:hypothetical protein